MDNTDLVFDAVVAGAGVVGLAIARELAMGGLQTLLLESEPVYGSGISSRNSEVIHAGMYYAPGSLKARLCVEGNRALYAYCAEKGVAFQPLGKLIVAVEEDELAALRSYQARGQANGVSGLRWLDPADIQALEPQVQALAGLYSPTTGIIDSHGLMRALLADFEQAGGIYVAHSKVQAGSVGDGTIRLKVGGRDPCTVHTPRLVNAAGMGAQALAHSLAGFPPALVPGLYYAIGHYFALSGRSPFSHLVYPVAVAGGLGVHVTLDLAGAARFGPDLAWRATEDYCFDGRQVDDFYRAIRRYWPSLPDGALQPAYTGIRPKLYGPERPDQDFLILGPQQHGIAGLVHLFGIESPGLTASLALAGYVRDLLQDGGLPLFPV